MGKYRNLLRIKTAKNYISNYFFYKSIMLSKIYKKEIKAFNVFTTDAKKLLIVNLIYALVFPFIIIFRTAFVKRITGGDNNLAVLYNWFFWGGINYSLLSQPNYSSEKANYYRHF